MLGSGRCEHGNDPSRQTPIAGILSQCEVAPHRSPGKRPLTIALLGRVRRAHDRVGDTAVVRSGVAPVVAVIASPESDHRTSDRGVIATDGERSCAGVGRRDRFGTISIARSRRAALPIAARCGHRVGVTAAGVKQARAPGCAETSRLAAKLLELGLLSAYAGR
jgi:hypothetical protein